MSMFSLTFNVSSRRCRKLEHSLQQCREACIPADSERTEEARHHPVRRGDVARAGHDPARAEGRARRTRRFCGDPGKPK